MINFLLVVAHAGTPDEHLAHMQMCEGCGIYGPCCEFVEFPVFGHPTMTVLMCEDEVRCGVRVHVMTHEPGRPYNDCVYCVSGTNWTPDSPVPDTVEEILKLMEPDPWRLN